jgi:hypothetical protein
MSDGHHRILPGNDPPRHSRIEAVGVAIVLVVIFVGAALFLGPIEAVLIDALALLLFGKCLIPRR